MNELLRPAEGEALQRLIDEMVRQRYGPVHLLRSQSERDSASGYKASLINLANTAALAPLAGPGDASGEPESPLMRVLKDAILAVDAAAAVPSSPAQPIRCKVCGGFFPGNCSSAADMCECPEPGIRQHTCQSKPTALCASCESEAKDAARLKAAHGCLEASRAALPPSSPVAPSPTLQKFYDLTTRLLSVSPTGRVDLGATQAYHDAMLALTTFRAHLRNDLVVAHDESFWASAPSPSAGAAQEPKP